VSWVEPATLPWSNCALAFDGTLPFNVVREDSSTGPLMRGATAELCPQDAEPHKNTLTIAKNEREHRRRIVKHPSLSFTNSKKLKTVLITKSEGLSAFENDRLKILGLTAIINLHLVARKDARRFIFCDSGSPDGKETDRSLISCPERRQAQGG
jgi:hypothetical protein